MRVEDVTKTYHDRRRNSESVVAVKGVSFDVMHGECLGIVGESGSGKTTLANCLVGLQQPTSGRILFDGKVVSGAGANKVPRVRGVQIVFQDPVSSLNPRRTVGSMLTEIFRVYRLANGPQVHKAASSLLNQVGLSPDLLERRPSRLSGGQQQRVAIARALAFDPRLIVADEIVSSLDASVQAQILNLLDDLRRLRDLSIVLITHDMAVARQLCDRLAVMHGGEIVEMGTVDSIFTSPRHEYTVALLNAVPRLAKRGNGRLPAA
jgi:peptide/nickel transport system ATP-binding protein